MENSTLRTKRRKVGGNVESYRILDATCGFREIWFEKDNALTVYIDIKKEVKPDIVADFKNLPFPEQTFNLVLFDPPHTSAGIKTVFAKKYGSIRMHKIISELYQTSRELFRVLKINGFLIFKWNTHHRKLDRILQYFPQKPLFGQKTAFRTKHASSTYWCLFLKRLQPTITIEKFLEASSQ